MIQKIKVNLCSIERKISRFEIIDKIKKYVLYGNDDEAIFFHAIILDS